jgi:hypothetical protein
LSTQTVSDTFVTVEVFDPNRHKSVLLEGLRSSATIAEVKARAIAALKLPSETEIGWNVRHDQTSRLLQEAERLGEVIDDRRTQVTLTMQPDAGLGC